MECYTCSSFKTNRSNTFAILLFLWSFSMDSLSHIKLYLLKEEPPRAEAMALLNTEKTSVCVKYQ